MPDLVLHAFTDGRDTLPTSGAGFLETVEGWMERAGAGRVGTVVGRYYAMDRDRRWDRVQRAYDLLVHGRAEVSAASAVQAIRDAYERDETDEFIEPVRVGEEARIRPGDSVLGLQLPSRSDARDHPRARRARVRRGRSRWRRAGRALRAA